MFQGIENYCMLIFLAGFGIASILAFLFLGKYISYVEKIEKMMDNFKAEGHKDKWLK